MKNIIHLLIIFIGIFPLSIHSKIRVNQRILLGPHPIQTYSGRTIHLPCIVTKQSDAIVTWCWNDFCTLGKAQFLRHQTSIDGLISIYQYTAYPRFYLFINEHLRMLEKKRKVLRRRELFGFRSL